MQKNNEELAPRPIEVIHNGPIHEPYPALVVSFEEAGITMDSVRKMKGRTLPPLPEGQERSEMLKLWEGSDPGQFSGERYHYPYSHDRPY